MSRIEKAFIKKKLLIPFFVCGYPNLEISGNAIKEAVKNGADIIELGIPFSDPVSECPTVQKANIIALNNQITTDKVFLFVQELRKNIDIPIVFRTYANVIFSYGAEKFIATCKRIDIDGIIVPDLPYEEKDEFLPFCQRYGVHLISAVAEASKERIAMIVKEADSFVYVFLDNRDKYSSLIQTIKESTSIPCVVECDDLPLDQKIEADGVVILSSLIELFEKYGIDAPKYIGKYIHEINS